MGKVASYRAELARVPPDAWPAWLAERSNLPGPRANLELVAAAAEEADEATALTLRENLRKARLQHLDPDWAARWLA